MGVFLVPAKKGVALKSNKCAFAWGIQAPPSELESTSVGLVRHQQALPPRNAIRGWKGCHAMHKRENSRCGSSLKITEERGGKTMVFRVKGSLKSFRECAKTKSNETKHKEKGFLVRQEWLVCKGGCVKEDWRCRRVGFS
jgi:hypothetical protein